MVGLIDKIVSVFKPRDTLNGSSESFCDSYYSSREGKLVLKLQKIASEYPFVEVGGLIHKTRDDFEISDFTVGNVGSINLPNKDSYARWHSHPQKIYSEVLIFSNNVPSPDDVATLYFRSQKVSFIVGPLYTTVLEKPRNYDVWPLKVVRIIHGLNKNISSYLDTYTNVISEEFGFNTRILRNAYVPESYVDFLRVNFGFGSLDEVFSFVEENSGLKPGEYYPNGAFVPYK